MAHTIEDAKRKAKRYRLKEAVSYLKTYGEFGAVAVYQMPNGYICARDAKAKMLYRHAQDHGHTDPHFLAFYQGPHAWNYFLDDCQVVA